MQSVLRFLFRNHVVARPFGIEVGLHGSLIAFALVIIAMNLASGGPLAALLWVFLAGALFTTVALHELGHSLSARAFGVGTRTITLTPIGGIAALESDLPTPKAEAIVALAGPAVNFVLAGIVVGVQWLTSAWLPVGAFGEALLGYLLLMNLMLGGFNLLPAFPMDGGRVLRAALTTRLGKLRATRIAARVGMSVAAIFFVAGLFFDSMLSFIGIFVYFAANSELKRVEYEARGPFHGGGGPVWFTYGSSRRPGRNAGTNASVFGPEDAPIDGRGFRVTIHPPRAD
ncbi:MAG: site-2 protease family protein [Planctomycetota bacterium]|jgi:stage IV sporulation protein FB